MAALNVRAILFRKASEKARMALNIGDPAPDFELPDHTGRLIRLRDFRGNRSVVLAFYVYANTPG